MRFSKPIPVGPKQDNFDHALLFCVRSLSAKMQGESLIREKLVTRGYSDAVIHEVVDFCKAERYLNDERLANMVVENLLSGGRGTGMVARMKLKKLGVSAELIDAAIRVQSTEIDIEGVLAATIARKFPSFNPQNKDQKQFAKIVGKYTRKGYSYGQIRTAFQVLADNAVDDDNDDDELP